MTNLQFFIKRWSEEFPVFVRVLKALPQEKLDYRPHPRSRSAAELLSLLVTEEQTSSEMLDTGQINWQEPAPASQLSQAVQSFEKAHQELENRLKKLDETNWEKKKAKLVVGGQAVLEETFADMLWMTFFDMIHHRGQLSTYIRPMGGKVPSIYGPSADDMGM